MKLWLVRHALPQVAAGTCYGRLDVAADPAATRQCAQALAARLPHGIRVTSSPLQRCEQLAPVLRGLRPDLAYSLDARLQEMDFGGWEGRPWQTLATAELQAWTDDFAHYAAGGPGHPGESVTAFMARVASAFDELRREAAAPDVLWITHAGVIRAVNLLAAGQRHITRADQWPPSAPDYGQWQTMVL